jgi:hypothetical protein
MAAPISLRDDFDGRGFALCFFQRMRSDPRDSRSCALEADRSRAVVHAEYGISVTKQILSRELRALGYRKLSARPRHHEHDEAAIAVLKKVPNLLPDISHHLQAP